jgi:hypothetical protein
MGRAISSCTGSAGAMTTWQEKPPVIVRRCRSVSRRARGSIRGPKASGKMSSSRSSTLCSFPSPSAIPISAETTGFVIDSIESKSSRLTPR